VCCRCCSLESPKKLRFAMHHDDGTPVRRRPSGVAEEEDEYCCDRHLSVSCPCIDHFDQDPSAAGKRPANCGALLQAPVSRVPGFPRVNSAPVTPMAADCLEMTAVSSLSGMDDVNEPLIKSDDYSKDGAITFVWPAWRPPRSLDGGRGDGALRLPRSLARWRRWL